jgi:hypothetical protein
MVGFAIAQGAGRCCCQFREEELLERALLDFQRQCAESDSHFLSVAQVIAGDDALGLR